MTKTLFSHEISCLNLNSVYLFLSRYFLLQRSAYRHVRRTWYNRNHTRSPRAFNSVLYERRSKRCWSNDAHSPNMHAFIHSFNFGFYLLYYFSAVVIFIESFMNLPIILMFHATKYKSNVIYFQLPFVHVFRYIRHNVFKCWCIWRKNKRLFICLFSFIYWDGLFFCACVCIFIHSFMLFLCIKKLFGPYSRPCASKHPHKDTE